MEKLEKFRKLGLSDKTLRALEEKGYNEPTPIQELTIPALLNGEKDIIGQAQTGTGKTAAFSLPILEGFEPNGNIQAIVLAPTRELALQVANEMESLSLGKNIKITPVYGGQAMDIQIRRLKKGTDIVVGTPGRVIDLMERKFIKLQNLRFFILDEADEMLNMGFLEEIEKILSNTNQDKRMLFFSATMPKEIMKVAKEYMGDYEVLAVKSKELTTNLTEQIYYEVKDKDKFEVLCRILDLTFDFYGIIFCKTKNDANDLVGKLNDKGYGAEGLHGDISQNYREVTLNRFRDKKINILVATDVAARGIDINDLTHVINYSIPQEAESYVHRIGRTGRAGKEGVAITFVTGKDKRRLQQIEKIVKTKIKLQSIPEIKDVILAKKVRLTNDIATIMGSYQEKNRTLEKITDELLKNNSPEEVVYALLENAYGSIFDENNYTKIEEVKVDKSAKVRLFIAMGKDRNMNPKKLVSLLSRKSRVNEKRIREVEVMDNFSFVTVSEREADAIIESFANEKSGKKMLIERAKKTVGKKKKK